MVLVGYAGSRVWDKAFLRPEVIYLGSGSEEKSMGRWIAKIFRSIGVQYTIGTFL